MIKALLLFFVVSFIFLFTFWRKLKDDYVSKHLFTSGFYIIFSSTGTLVLSYKFMNEYFFWMTYVVFILSIIATSIFYKMRYFEEYEAAIMAVLPVLSLLFGYQGIVRNDWYLFGYSVFGFLFILFYLFLNSRYKNFGWYKSGRVGFASLTTMGVYFLTRGVIAILFPNMLSFIGDYETIVSGLAAFTHFLLVYNLSRKI